MKNDDYMNVTYDTPNESDNFQFPINPDDPNPFKEVPADRTDGNFKSLMSDDMRATYLNDEINKLDSGEESPFDENGEYRNNTNMPPIVSVVEQPKKKFSFNFKLDTKKKKIYASIAAVVVVAIGVICAILLPKTPEERRLEEIYNPKKLMIYEYDKNYGYMNSKGKKVIDPIYTFADSFHGNYAVVSQDEADEKRENRRYQIINKKGRVKKEVYSTQPKYYTDYSVWLIDGIIYDKNLKEVTTPDKTYVYLNYGYFYSSTETYFEIIDYQNNVIYTEQTSKKLTAEISINDNYEAEYYVMTSRQDGTNKVIGLKSKNVVYSIIDGTKEKLSVKNDNIFNVISKTDNKIAKWIYLEDGGVAYEVSSDVVNMSFYNYDNRIVLLDYGEDYASKGKEYRLIYYDIKNRKEYTEEPNPINLEVSSMEKIYGYRPYSCDKTIGLNKDGLKVTECYYDNINFLSKNLYNYMLNETGKRLALLTQNDETFLVDLNTKKTVTSFNTKKVQDNGNSSFLIGIVSNEQTGKASYIVYNVISGKSIVTSENEAVTINPNYVIVFNDEIETYYNTKLERIYSNRKK